MVTEFYDLQKIVIANYQFHLWQTAKKIQFWHFGFLREHCIIYLLFDLYFALGWTSNPKRC